MVFEKVQFQKIADFAMDKLLPAVIIFILGFIVLRVVVKIVVKSLDKSKHIDSMLNRFITSVVKVCLWTILLLQVIRTLGIDATSLLTVVAAAGAAVALALQGSLSNLASGIIIIVTKPFSHGDYIQGGGNEGKVESIDLLYTTIITVDNRVVTVPNSALTSGNIVNFYRGGERRIDVKIGISYESDLTAARNVLIEIAHASGYYNEEKGISCDVVEYADSSINLRLRGWVKATDYWKALDAVNNSIKPEFDKNNIEIPYPQLDVHTK